MKVKLLTSAAKMPTSGSKEAAGYDLYSSEDAIIPPFGRLLISTGIAVAIPQKHYGRVAPRSGLAVHSGVNVLAGVVDSDYRGEVKVALHNTDPTETVFISTGDRIAQLIVTPIHKPVLEEVDNLEETERASAGFGSTGK
jgi:dUTP pyrophosphatase